MQFAGQLTPEEFWAEMDAADDEVRRTFTERPVYGVRAWPGRVMLSEWAFHRGIRSLAFLPAEWEGVIGDDGSARPRVEVLVDDLEPRRMIADRIALEVRADGREPQWPWLEAPTPDAVIDLDVDGIDEPFELWVNGDSSRAAGRIGGVTVMIEALEHPISDVALERVRDIDVLLAERRQWIRDLRGGQ